MYREYCSWCKVNGHCAFSKIKFGKEFFRICKPRTLYNCRKAFGDREHIWPDVYIKGIGDTEDSEEVKDWDE